VGAFDQVADHPRQVEGEVDRTIRPQCLAGSELMTPSGKANFSHLRSLVTANGFAIRLM
jgi:hypothetical protein